MGNTGKMRQGDVMMETLSAESRKKYTADYIRKNGSRVKQDCVAFGEHSGHHHMATGEAEVYELDGRMFTLTGKAGAKLEHINTNTGGKADHDAITLEPNEVYEVIHQNVFNPLEKAMQRVRD